MPWYPDILKDPEFREEISQEESPLSPAYPLAGKSLGPARVAGRLVRYAMEAPKELGRIWDRAKEGKTTLGDSISAAMYGLAPSRGPGLGSGPRMRAAPWQSRTLDFVLGNPGPWKKPPEAASPQTWLSKAKGAGLPKEETQILTPFLESADPKSKLTGRQIAEGIEGKGPGTLPTLGVTKTELGGSKYKILMNKIDELTPELKKAEEEYRTLIDKYHGSDKISSMEDMHPKVFEAFNKHWDLVRKQDVFYNKAEELKAAWPQYQLEGVENPREILYHAKSKEGGDYINSDMRIHFGEKGKNLAWFQQEGDLKMPDGKMSNHISGLQNDWAAEYSKANFFIDHEGKKYNRNNLTIKETESLNGEKRYAVMTKDGTEAPDYPLFESKKLAEKEIGAVPEPPMKDTWWKTGLKDAVKRAVEEGKDYLSWDTAAIQSKRFPDPKEGTHKYFQQHYDENIPKFLAKEYEVKPEKVGLENKYGLTVDYGEPYGVITFDRNRVSTNYNDNTGLYTVTLDDGRQISGGFTTRQEALEWMNSNTKKVGSDKEVWRIPITEEMKRKIVLEGQYFTKQTAKPGGRNAEMAA